MVHFRFFAAVCFLAWGFTLFGAEHGYQRVARVLHSEYRAKHHASPLRGSYYLNNRAERCAQYYANIGKIDHSCPYKNGAGENLRMMWGAPVTNVDAAKRAIESWYSEVSNYKYDGQFAGNTGHFTQLVWKSSNEFGFGVARAGGKTYACALYKPHGNFLGRFIENVQRP